jgi:TatD DNase family protein
MLPALDAHAHVKLSVPPPDLEGLDALVFAVTREPSEWAEALGRSDQMTIWGIGAHPRFSDSLRTFSRSSFAAAVDQCLLVGEVGLDAKADAPLSEGVFREVLAVVAELPRPTSIHSQGASRKVLSALSATPIACPILHWWTGGTAETDEAVAMGAWFSLNGAAVRRPEIIERVPPERILTETDFPHSRGLDKRAIAPASVATIEAALMREWGLDEYELRRRLWRNVAALFQSCALLDHLPETVQDVLLTVGWD